MKVTRNTNPCSSKRDRLRKGALIMKTSVACYLILIVTAGVAFGAAWAQAAPLAGRHRTPGENG
jgi:hypothetical protein